MSMRTLLAGSWVLLLCAGCSGTAPAETSSAPAVDATGSTQGEDVEASSRVAAVEVSPAGNGYNFSLTIESDETGCDRYANWWEVVTPEGVLLYRRILAHSHADEQPFTRSGGPVAIGEGDVVVVRSHVDPDGYSTRAMKGTISEGFSSANLAEDFATELKEMEPQPNECAF